MPDEPSSDRDKNILTAAEELFALHGYDGATLRQITQVAGVNLAAVNYHFSDKETLFCAVVSRRLRPLNESRLAKLQEIERDTKGAPVPLAVLIDLLARPVFELGLDRANGGAHAVRIIGRLLTEPQPFMAVFLAREFQPCLTRFSQALKRHMPALAPEDFLWRFSFVVGAMHHTLATLHGMKEMTRGICRDDDYAGALQRFISFAVSTFTPRPGQLILPPAAAPVN